MDINQELQDDKEAGEKKLFAAVNEGKKVMLQTSPTGRKDIQRQIDSGREV